jgi:flagellar basal body-associated protein FliL
MKIAVSRPDVVVTPPKKSRRTLYVILAIVVVLVLVVLVIIGSLGSSQPKQPVVITTAADTDFVVAGGYYRPFNFTLSGEARVTGAFTANPAATLYIVSPGEPIYSNGPNQYFYTSGSVASDYVDTNLQSGSYQLIFNNEWSNVTSISVHISQQFNATYIG